jgi:hypothetical protein
VYFGDGTEGSDSDGAEDSDSDNDEAVQEWFEKRWNLNMSFRTDSSHTRLRPEQFDLINCRFLSEGINRDRWPTLIGELRLLLKPGGWLQMVELELRFQSDNGPLGQSNNEPLYVWGEVYRRQMEQANKDPRIGSKLIQYLRRQGFEHVLSRTVRLQIGDWNQGQSSIRALMHSAMC